MNNFIFYYPKSNILTVSSCNSKRLPLSNTIALDLDGKELRFTKKHSIKTPKGKTIVFEPTPKSLSYLKENIIKDKDDTVYDWCKYKWKEIYK